MMRASVEHYYDSAHRLPPMARELIELMRHGDLVRQLVVRNIKVRYKRSALGVAWSMLAPLLTMTVLSLVFAGLFRSSAPDYPVYLFPGLLIWTFFAQTTSMMAAEMIGGVDLWKRIYTPRTVFAVATLATGLVHLALAMIPLACVALAYRASLGPALLVVPFAALCTALFALGIGLVLAVLAGYFPDVVDLYQVILSAWLYLTPVIYPRTIVPNEFQWLLALNPMTYFVESFRTPIYDGAVPPLHVLSTALLIALASVVLGWWLFTRSVDALSYRV